MFDRYKKSLFVIALLLILLVVASAWSFVSGDIEIYWRDIPSILNQPDSLNYSVLTQLRLPRMLLAFAVGSSLSLAGVILQGIYRNPLVEPFTLGISGGASLAVAGVLVWGITLPFQNYILPVAGFVGAVITIILVYSIGMSSSKSSIQRMLLTGVMISFVCSSLLMFILSVSTSENLHNIIFWTMGSLEEPDNTLIFIMLLVSLVIFILVHFFVHPLNALRLGHREATHLGVNVLATVRILFLLTSLLTGLCVSIAGIIGFIGLVVPHIMRKLVGTDYRVLFTASYLGGGLYLMVCDVLARTLISPNELPVGVLTGVIGGILFILMLSKNEIKWEK